MQNMTESDGVSLPPAPKVDGRSKAARQMREDAKASLHVQTQPTPQEHSRERRRPEPVVEQVRHVEMERGEKLADVRERPARAEKTRRERRRRENVDRTIDLRLSFRFTPDPNKEYRWVNEGIDSQRLKDFTVDDDWDPVNADGELSDGNGGAVRRAVGMNPNGPTYSYLLAKDKDWHEADRKSKHKRLDDMMRLIQEGKPPTEPGRALKQSDHVYGTEDISFQDGRRR